MSVVLVDTKQHDFFNMIRVEAKYEKANEVRL
jgi:hypothetical protein